ncbi:hypothetical protein N7495_001436 [Penicillium taxi]|uniref:uncharacterized protein n=1 Tax=Penicillium taxi TaxID=168475 RepID=UPI00254592BC|nr:uncharacterized protein N7495_001436 [Penicillium taxi]KAJ5908754.1 hypothetical protein N7495_001436 [Penicillium taxi]
MLILCIRYCMVYANTAAFASAEKLRMPGAKLVEDDDDDDDDDSAEDSDDDDDDYCGTGHENFKNNHELINEYITAMGADATTAIRIVNDDAATLEWEIVIPPAMLNSNNGGLSIGTVCKQSKSQLPTLENVAVESYPWTENVKGDWDTWIE